MADLGALPLAPRFDQVAMHPAHAKAVGEARAVPQGNAARSGPVLPSSSRPSARGRLRGPCLRAALPARRPACAPPSLDEAETGHPSPASPGIAKAVKVALNVVALWMPSILQRLTRQVTMPKGPSKRGAPRQAHPRLSQVGWAICPSSPSGHIPSEALYSAT